MSKALLWIGIVLGAVYIMKTQFLNSKTYDPFKQGCIAGGYSEAQCGCLADYVHERLSDQEVQGIMDNRVSDPGFAARVNSIRVAGNLACNIGQP